MLDSGASYHACLRKKWFSTFEKIDSGVVVMENDHTWEMSWIGTVRIKMFGVVRELLEVRYLPQLKMNLISLKALESLGHKVIESGVFKVIVTPHF